MSTSFKQYVFADNITPLTNDAIDRAEQIVIANLRSQLAADDDPTNDFTPVSIIYSTDGDPGCGPTLFSESEFSQGIWVIGTVDRDIFSYPKYGRHVWEVEGAQEVTVS